MNRLGYLLVVLTLCVYAIRFGHCGDTLASLLKEPFKALDRDNKETDRAVHRLIKTVYSSLRATEQLNKTVQRIQGGNDNYAEIEGMQNDLSQLNTSLVQLKELAETDDCASSPCVHGQCRDFLTGYNCHCYSGYAGTNCDDIDDCPANGCHGNGDCVDLDGGYECICFKGYGGSDCDIKDDDIVFQDCKDVLDNVDGAESGVYTIRVVSDGDLTTRVFCDMDTDGGGWTVFQKRFNGQQDFHRSHQEYADGFGDPAGEYWLGLNWLHSMTSQKSYQLRVDLTAADNSMAYQVYRTFSIGPAPFYRLTALGTSGNAGDALYGDNGDPFVTKDNSTEFCVSSYRTSWWQCNFAFLNSDYIQPGTSPKLRLQAVIWYTSWRKNEPLKATSMKIKPVN